MSVVDDDRPTPTCEYVAKDDLNTRAEIHLCGNFKDFCEKRKKTENAKFVTQANALRRTAKGRSN